MMTIEQADKVDGVGIDKHANEVVLLISDHLLWDDEGAHISSLEYKLGAYINYINSGQHLESIPQARGLPVRIRLVHEHPPTSSAQVVLRAIETQLETMKIRFSYGPLPAHPAE
jgi:hypothetical protein